MIADFEELFQERMQIALSILQTENALNWSIEEISHLLRPIFDAIVLTMTNQSSLSTNEVVSFTQTLCFNASSSILDHCGMAYLILDLPLIARYIAGQAAVAYSICGVVDTLDTENKPLRIAAAFNAAVSYLLASKFKKPMKPADIYY
ncbi:MAG: hypothetical protein ACFFED_08835 [Candidatus Thorarchaeota archaeon]